MHENNNQWWKIFRETMPHIYANQILFNQNTSIINNIFKHTDLYIVVTYLQYIKLLSISVPIIQPFYRYLLNNKL